MLQEALQLYDVFILIFRVYSESPMLPERNPPTTDNPRTPHPRNVLYIFWKIFLIISLYNFCCCLYLKFERWEQYVHYIIIAKKHLGLRRPIINIFLNISCMRCPIKHVCIRIKFNILQERLILSYLIWTLRNIN